MITLKLVVEGKDILKKRNEKIEPKYTVESVDVTPIPLGVEYHANIRVITDTGNGSRMRALHRIGPTYSLEQLIQQVLHWFGK